MEKAWTDDEIRMLWKNQMSTEHMYFQQSHMNGLLMAVMVSLG